MYSKTGLGDGQQANNPWLQELPDPITRVSWDNYLTVSKFDAQELGLKNYTVANGALDSNYAQITVNGVTINNVPVMIQPGQAKGTVGLSFGYGRKRGIKEVMMTGVSGYELFKDSKSVQSIKITATDEIHEFACVQLHNTLMGRGDVIKETNLEIFNTKGSNVWNDHGVIEP